MKDSTKRIFEELFDHYPVLAACKEDIRDAYAIMKKAFEEGKKLLVCGNGGSAADSEHIVGELMKSFKIPRPVERNVRMSLQEKFPNEGTYLADHLQKALKAIALTSNGTLFSAYCNDVDADMVFAQQVYGYCEKSDVLLGISTSGKAKNVNNAIKTAKSMGVIAIGLCKADGGEMNGLCDVCIKVPAKETYQVQELHLPVYHALCAMLENEFFG